jgi:TPR repeat protein
MTAAALLAGCASWVDDRREPTAEPDAGMVRDSAARKRAFDADLRARLEELRRRPDLASDDLIRELERFVHDRNQQPPAAAAASPAPAPALPVPAVPAVPAAKPAPRVIVARPPAAKSSPKAEAPAVTMAAVPAAAPAPKAAAVVPSTLSQAEQLFRRARNLESDHQLAQAVPLYNDASRQGLAAATLRLMEIYARGGQGVARNYLAAVKYKDLAVQQGVELDYPPRR